MALAKQYLSIDGEVLMESKTSPSDRVMYVRDGLGSVVATADSKGNVLNTYMYKPSGAVWQKTGSAPDPRFLWCGTWGYRVSSNSWNSHYVRARHYSHNSGAWTTVDPLWPSEAAYGYVGGRAMSAVDPSGMMTSASVALTMPLKGPTLSDPECSVYIYETEPGKWFGVRPGHRFIYASIENRNWTTHSCSGGLMPTFDNPRGNVIVGQGYISDKGHISLPSDIPGVHCARAVWRRNSADACRFASAVCNCIDKADGSSNTYAALGNNCVDFTYWVLECSCVEGGRMEDLLENVAQMAGHQVFTEVRNERDV